jgi:hypothetical protein
VVKDFIDTSVRRAERASSVALVIQLDSGGTLLSATELDALASELSGREQCPAAIELDHQGDAAGAFGPAHGGVYEVLDHRIDAAVHLDHVDPAGTRRRAREPGPAEPEEQARDG